jgi:hypothetical protein
VRYDTGTSSSTSSLLADTQAHLLDADSAAQVPVSSDAQQLSCFNRKKWLFRAIFFQKIYFIFAAGVTGYSITTDGGLVDSLGLMPYFALVTIWNKTDVVRAALEAPDAFQALKEECSARNFFQALLVSYGLLIESSATIWATYSAIQSAQKEDIRKVFFVSNDTLGDNRISALATVSFGVNALLSGMLLLMKQEKNTKDAIEFFAHLTCVLGAGTGVVSLFAEKFYLYLSTIFYSVSAILHNVEYLAQMTVVLMQCCNQTNAQSVNDARAALILSADHGSETRSASSVMITVDGDDEPHYEPPIGDDFESSQTSEPPFDSTVTQAALVVVCPKSEDDKSEDDKSEDNNTPPNQIISTPDDLLNPLLGLSTHPASNELSSETAPQPRFN